MSFIIIGVVGAVVGVVKLGMAMSDRKKAKKEQAAAKTEMDKYKAEYAAIDTSNPYANMENTMEDLTVNQQQAQFESQQGQQQRSNIMQQMQGAAGGSGIAGLAQAMANQGQLATQRAGASIGRQEGQINMATARQAAANDLQFRQGEARSQDLKRDKVATQMGMAAGRQGAAAQSFNQARKREADAYGDIGSGVATSVGGQDMADAKARANAKG